jgi:hypothetical protein
LVSTSIKRRRTMIEKNPLSPGMKKGNWTLIERLEPVNGNQMWLCTCECGTKRRVRQDALKNGISRSCGCLSKKVHHHSIAVALSYNSGKKR